ncbi:MAG: hypothetical protein ACJAT6_001667, partial [Akkermansiaceae bacterium]
LKPGHPKSLDSAIWFMNDLGGLHGILKVVRGKHLAVVSIT